ncbi:MAG: glycosyltransferase family 2 protein [Flavobacteriales bacterium]
MREALKISIITPSYNQGRYIEETIRSVVDQNYPNLEYIIMDGGSKDNTVEVIKKYADKITYWESKKDKGQSDAINKGLKKASGDIVAWLNSDDMYTENALQRVADIFAKNPDVDIVYGNVWQFYPKGKTEKHINKKFNPKQFLTGVNMHQPSVFWRRKVHEEIGFLDEALYYTMDYDLWLRLFYNYKSYKTDTILSRFRCHEEAKTSNNPKGIYMDYRKCISRFFRSAGFDQHLPMMRVLKIYDHSDKLKYPVSHSFTDKAKQDIIDEYAFNCAIQEYSFGNVSASNKILNYCLTTSHKRKVRTFMIKNNLGVRKMLNLFRQT